MREVLGMTERSRVVIVLRALLSLAVLAVGIVAILAVLGSLTDPSPGQEATTEDQAPPEDQRDGACGLDDYTWQELSDISAEIAAAGGGDASVAVAASYGLVNPDGSLTGEAKRIRLSDGTEVGLVIAGICHDTVTGTGSPAGLTFVSDAAIALRPMNASGDNAGGWESSELRSWLGGEGFSQLPDDLRSVVVAVDKPTNNVGSAWSAEQVSLTSDRLWLLSATEACGTIDWFAHEYPAEYSFWDDVANAEGSQYQLFSQAGVSARDGAGGVLARRWQGSPVAWWYRSAFCFVYDNLEGRYFYGAMPSGYPCSHATPDTDQGVVIGLCL